MSHSRQSSWSSLADGWFSSPQNRRLSLTHTIPYSPNITFAALADISSYERATSLIYSSSVTATNPTSGFPSAATLQVGYPPIGLAEEWRVRIRCDRASGVVEARNAASSEGSSSSVIELYVMRWTVSPGSSANQAVLKLEMEVKFRGVVVDSMFAVLQPVTAAKTMLRFEALIKAYAKKEGTRARAGSATALAVSALKTGGIMGVRTIDAVQEATA